MKFSNKRLCFFNHLDREIIAFDLLSKLVISLLDLEEQSEISIRCNVLSNNAQADIIPGNMIFKIGNKELENDDNQLEFDDSKKVWYKMLNYKPDIYDNGEILKCVLNPKSKHETSENLNIHLYKFKVINSGKQIRFQRGKIIMTIVRLIKTGDFFS